MKIKVIADSCCDLLRNQIDSEALSYASVPLTIRIDNENYVDNEHFGCQQYADKMNASNEPSTTGCPSPGGVCKRIYQESITFCVYTFVRS